MYKAQKSPLMHLRYEYITFFAYYNALVLIYPARASTGCSCNNPLVQVDFQQARVSAGYSCDDLLVQLKSILLHLARASAGCSYDDLLVQIKLDSALLRKIASLFSEKTTIQTAFLRYLNIFRRALTQHAYKQEVKESINISDIHEQIGQCIEPIAKNSLFFDNNIDDESYDKLLNLCDDNSNCEISEVDLNTEKPELDFVFRNNYELDLLLDNRLVDCPAIINDIMKLQLGSLP
ncbi:3268_t:CDS:2 [Funneliformis mosseae]|uniref:3268_t:CDS:1 n=1 Tax=Funneliformis mosseae TaxID=27381 RepID=A0A9N9E0W1_FUNMO|nr:3268_t:CDS:2 [Funneliformis mosseae]